MHVTNKKYSILIDLLSTIYCILISESHLLYYTTLYIDPNQFVFEAETFKPFDFSTVDSYNFDVDPDFFFLNHH